MARPELNPTAGLLAERRAMKLRIIIYSADSELVLKQFIPGDAYSVVKNFYRNREHYSQYGEVIRDYYKSPGMFRESVSRPSSIRPDDFRDRLRFGIWNKNEELMGETQLYPEDYAPHQGRIGYRVGKEFTNQKVAQRAVAALTDYAFDHMGFEVLYADVRYDNFPSRTVLQRNKYHFINQVFLINDKQYMRYVRKKNDQ